MREKNKRKIIIVITIIAVAIIFLMIFLFNEDDSFIKIRLYDKNGNIINQPLSISTIPLSYFMDITLNVKNNGNINLNCYPSQISPVEWEEATNKTSRTIYQGLSTEWTSNLINLSKFTGKPQPTRFQAIVTCSYSDVGGNHYINQSGFIDYNINSVCGDNFCDLTETENTCPIDCFIGNKVFFRTSDLNYGIQSAIAYSPICGYDLTRYGIERSACWNVLDQTCPIKSGFTLVLNQSYNIVGSPLWARGSIGCFYSNNTDSNDVAMAWKVTGSGSLCGIQGQWGVKIYSKTSPYAINVDNSRFHIDGSVNELNC